MAIKIVLVDDHFVVREGMRQIIALYQDMIVSGEASNGEELLAMLTRGEVPDLVLMDMTMPGLSGSALVARVKESWPKLPVLVLSMHKDSQMAFDALKAGASGYVTKDSEPSRLAQAIRKVSAGNRYVVPDLAEDMIFDAALDQGSRIDILSPREKEILRLLVAGEPLVQIAERLHISAKTISTHKMRLMQKLNVRNNAELILIANASGVGSEGEQARPPGER